MSMGRWIGGALDPLWTNGTLGPPWSRAEVVAKAHRSTTSPAFSCMGPRRGGAGRKRRGWESLPGWHEAAEGLEWSAVGDGRRWWSELNEKVLRAQR
jgi:hypothetical protein